MKPILQKFKEAGKSAGSITAVPITRATPAGFCVNNKTRSRQDEIASDYFTLKFDVMMGGGQAIIQHTLLLAGREWTIRLIMLN